MIFDDFSGDGDFVENVPQQNANHDVVFQIENDAFAVIFSFFVGRLRRLWHLCHLRFRLRFSQRFAAFWNCVSTKKIESENF